MKNNDITLFSNGIGHFRRYYEVTGEDRKISIPFNKKHIGDVAGSLQVFGKVALSCFPTFIPSNSDDVSLKLDDLNSLESLVRKLTGAEVKMKVGISNPEEKFVLVGLDTENTVCDKTLLNRTYIVVMNEAGQIKRFPKENFIYMEFADDSVKAEIRKALDKKYKEFKPDSTFLDLTLRALEGAESVVAQVQYTLPVAAWKMRYSIRQNDDVYTFEGAAIIDNNTDEDWDNFVISVVTGNPVSFATDIADVVVPNRELVHLVDGNALGNVSVARTVATAGCAPKGRGMLRSQTTSNYLSFGMESADSALAEYEAEEGPAAVSTGIDSREIGDFCVFTSKEPISILAKRSAIVPMFSVPLTKAGTVLYYQPEKHTRRMYRTIKFKNETDYSLGKGKTSIYNNGVFSGECVLDMTKPGENRVLPHCLENGVKIYKEFAGSESKIDAITIADSIAIKKSSFSTKTKYVVRNNKNESFKILFEYTYSLRQDMRPRPEVSITGISVYETEQTTDGVRVYFEINPSSELVFEINELMVESQKVELQQAKGWLINLLTDDHCFHGSLMANPTLSQISKIDEEMKENRENYRNQEDLLEDLVMQMNRIRENLRATGSNHATSDTWIDDLKDAEMKHRDIKDKIMPELNKKHRELDKSLHALIKEIKFES